MFNRKRKLAVLRPIVVIALLAHANATYADEVQKEGSQDAELQLALVPAPESPQLVFIIRNRTDHEIMPHMCPGTFLNIVARKQGDQPEEYSRVSGAEDPSLVRQMKPGDTSMTMFGHLSGYFDARKPGTYEVFIEITDGSYAAKVEANKRVLLKTNTVFIYVPDPQRQTAGLDNSSLIIHEAPPRGESICFTHPMQNAAVAQMFEDIADLLEIEGENPFQIRAYRRAAEAVSNYPTAIEDLTVPDLKAISGLGPATADKTREFLATGRVAFLERLREEYPHGVLELARVPGLGPKKVQMLYKERGIASIETLQNALTGGELVGLPGFGPKTLANLQASIKRLGEMSTELPLFDALPLAVIICERLAESGATVEIAGDVRRGRETAASLDWVACGDAAQQAGAADAFKNLSMLQELKGETPQRLDARIRPGVDATLHLAGSADFGSVLFRATGSAAHIEAAAKRGYIGDADFSTEAALYAALDSEFIEPELREEGWNSRTDLVRLLDICGDLHAHSTWSDGSASIREMVAAAAARGYTYHAVTDHSKALAMANGLDAKRLREQAAEIAEVQAEFPHVKILRGIECDIMRDGSMDLDDDVLAELDWVVGSVHSAFNLDEATQTARIVKALSHPRVHCIGHPTGRIVGSRPAYDVNIAEVVAAAREYGKALEINASYRLDLKAEHAAMAREAGVPLCINTDAHSTRMLPFIELGILTARRAGCQAGDVLNTKSADELMAWLEN